MRRLSAAPEQVGLAAETTEVEVVAGLARAQ